MALTPIQVGVEAPEFELSSNLPTETGKPGKKIKLADYRGEKNVLLAFYPLDFSPVCTTENVCFQQDAESFAATNTQVLGISVDSAWTHAAFARQLELSYPLLADFHPRGEVARKFGLYLEESGITARATVIIDKAGRVAFVEVQQIPDPRANQRILKFLQSMSSQA